MNADLQRGQMRSKRGKSFERCGAGKATQAGRDGHPKKNFPGRPPGGGGGGTAKGCAKAKPPNHPAAKKQVQSGEKKERKSRTQGNLRGAGAQPARRLG